MRKNKYYSIIDAIVDLQERGFFLDFSLVDNKLLCCQEKFFLAAEEFDVLEMYRFHAGHTSSVREETIVYAIESLSGSFRGILLNSGHQAKTLVHPILTRKLRKFWA
jgi:hypothetical protein